MRRTLGTLFVAAALAAALAACGESLIEDVTADATITADLAVAAGEDIATDVALINENEASVGGLPVARLGDAVPQASASCTRDSGTGVFSCTATTEGGLTVTRTWTPLDATGTKQAAFNAATTASMAFTTTVTGTVTRTNFSSTINRSNSSTLSGLVGTETSRTWNGTGSSTTTNQVTRNSVQRDYSVTSKDTVTSVVVLVPRSSNKYPQSGTIVHNITSTLTKEGTKTMNRSISRRVMVTFNGTASVPVDVNGTKFTLNLDTRTVTAVQ